MIVYDTEIVKAIPNKKERALDDIDYCAGWHDHQNMGISVICAYDYKENRHRVFCSDNVGEFAELCEKRKILVGFNNIGFDNKLLATNNITIPENKSYDLLVKIWEGAGLAPKFSYPSHIGYGLEVVCKTNLGNQKTGSGALAPVLWQRGKYGAVIDYCLQDVNLTRMLLDYVIGKGKIKDPKTGKEIAIVRPSLS